MAMMWRIISGIAIHRAPISNRIMNWILGLGWLCSNLLRFVVVMLVRVMVWLRRLLELWGIKVSSSFRLWTILMIPILVFSNLRSTKDCLSFFRLSGSWAQEISWLLAYLIMIEINFLLVNRTSGILMEIFALSHHFFHELYHLFWNLNAKILIGLSNMLDPIMQVGSFLQQVDLLESF